MEQLFDQTVNTVVYGQLLEEHFVASRPSRSSKSVVQELQLTKDEMNALRYASGYVARKLLKSMRMNIQERSLELKLSSLKSALVIWLLHMMKQISQKVQVNGFEELIVEVYSQ